MSAILQVCLTVVLVTKLLFKELPGFWGVKNVSEINLGVPGQVPLYLYVLAMSMMPKFVL